MAPPKMLIVICVAKWTQFVYYIWLGCVTNYIYPITYFAQNIVLSDHFWSSAEKSNDSARPPCMKVFTLLLKEISFFRRQTSSITVRNCLTHLIIADNRRMRGSRFWTGKLTSSGSSWKTLIKICRVGPIGCMTDLLGAQTRISTPTACWCSNKVFKTKTHR